jgi:hypothetical protein
MPREVSYCNYNTSSYLCSSVLRKGAQGIFEKSNGRMDSSAVDVAMINRGSAGSTRNSGRSWKK